MKRTKRHIISLTLTTGFAILIFILSIMPTDIHGEKPDFYFEGMDRFIHVGMYGLLTILILFTYFLDKKIKLRPTSIIIILVLLYSILMEFVQFYFIDYRSGYYHDVIANLVGILLATGSIILYRKIRA
mgnify:CR=1 FL=1